MRMLSARTHVPLICRNLNRVLILAVCSLCCQFALAQQSSPEGLFVVQKDGKSGFIDRTGKLVIPMKFTHAEDFSEGVAAVTDGDRDHGAFIDHEGKVIFTLPLDVTLGFHEGFAGVLLSGNVTYYDRRGQKMTVPTEYGPRSHSFSEGLVS